MQNDSIINTRFNLYNKQLYLYVLYFIIFSIFIVLKKYSIIRIFIEILCIIFAFIISSMAINTYGINRDNQLMILGISLGFVGLFDILYISTCEGIELFDYKAINISTRFWIMARCMQNLSFVISFLPIKKKMKLRNIILFFSSISIVMLGFGFYFNDFSALLIREQYIKNFKIYNIIVICAIIFLNFYYALKLRKNHVNNLLRLGQTSFLFSQLFFINFILKDNIFNLIGYILKFVSYHFILLALVKINIKEPYNNLVDVNNMLIDRNRELETIIEKLKSENELMIKRKNGNQGAIVEKIKEYDELKDIFLSTVAHEFRTPLTVILGILQLIDNLKYEGNCLNCSTIKEYNSILKQNCYRLIRRTNNLVDVNKIDTGFFDIELKNQDIISIIENITLTVADFIKNKGITLIFDTEVEEKIMACDSYLMERVMLNLLSNSVKFIENGNKIEVIIKDNKDMIMISVKDDGIGIPKEMADIIFDRFRQVDTLFNRRSEGSGIGLALVKMIVEEHNGRIYLNTNVESGTEFIIELPISFVGECMDDNLYIPKKTNAERIAIEFADIYGLD